MRMELLTPEYFSRRAVHDERSGCWLWHPRDGKDGYGQLWIDGKQWLAHRASWLIHFGSLPADMLVCHECDTPRCVNPEHLFLGTYQDNSSDCMDKGRAFVQRVGMDFSFTRLRRYRKLTDDQVKYIRESKFKLRELAVELKVSMSTISNIRAGKRKQLVK